MFGNTDKVIKNKDLDYGHAIIFNPQVSYSKTAAEMLPYKIDLSMCEENLFKGQQSISLGTWGVELAQLHAQLPRQAHPYNIQIKAANSDRHIIPAPFHALTPLFEQAAEHQYKYSPYARQQECIANISIYREIKTYAVFPGEVWHVHTFPPDGSEAFKNQSPKMFASEFFFSSCYGTEVQTSLANTPLYGEAELDTYIMNEHTDPDFTSRHMQDMEIITGTGLWHRSAQRKIESLYNSPRIFVLISYVHTHESAEQALKDTDQAASAPWFPDAEI